MTNYSSAYARPNPSESERLLAEIRYRFHYDPEIGELRWIRPRKASLKPGSIAGHVPKNGYRIVRLGSRIFRASHLIWLLATGTLPTRVYHLDKDPRNNKLSNLYV